MTLGDNNTDGEFSSVNTDELQTGDVGDKLHFLFKDNDLLFEDSDQLTNNKVYQRWRSQDGEDIAVITAHRDDDHYSIYTRDTAYDGTQGSTSKRLDIESGSVYEAAKWRNMSTFVVEHESTGGAYVIGDEDTARLFLRSASDADNAELILGSDSGKETWIVRKDSDSGLLKIIDNSSGTEQTRFVLNSDGSVEYVNAFPDSDGSTKVLGVYKGNGHRHRNRFQATGGVGTTSTGIIDFGFRNSEIVVQGEKSDDASVTFIEKILASRDGDVTSLGRSTRGSPASTTYSVNDTTLELAMGSDSYDITANARAYQF